MRIFKQKALPHLINLMLFIFIAFAYFPSIFENKELKTGDVTNWQGMAKELRDFEKETGEEYYFWEYQIHSCKEIKCK